MKYADFLTQVIDGGIEAAIRDYAKDKAKRDGAVAGFEACRGLHPGDLALLLAQARLDRNDAHERHHVGGYWYARTFELEVEWTCNVVGVAFSIGTLRRRLELPSPFVEWRSPPTPLTARGLKRAAELLDNANAT